MKIHESLERSEKWLSAIRKSNITHGMRHTPEYRVWADMRNRCENPNNAFGSKNRL